MYAATMRTLTENEREARCGWTVAKARPCGEQATHRRVYHGIDRTGTERRFPGYLCLEHARACAKKYDITVPEDVK